MEIQCDFDELADVFRQWKLDYINNPQEYSDEDDVEKYARTSADTFLELLTRIKETRNA